MSGVNVKAFRKYSLVLAETFDAWRVVPRLVLILYALMVVDLYTWFKAIPTIQVTRCDAALIEILKTNGMDIDKATELACNTNDVVGGPTSSQSAFVTTIIGLSTGIFGLYASTGRRWENGLPSDLDNKNNPKPDRNDDSPPPKPNSTTDDSGNARVVGDDGPTF
jgi:hypothetical protein